MRIAGVIQKCDIALVGECPGFEEVIAGTPFVGPSGQLLNRMLAMTGIDRNKCTITNVFPVRPPRNDVLHFFATKKATKVYTGMPKSYNGKYLKEEWLPDLRRLHDELAVAQPKVVVALGATALWALTGEDKITKHRGTLLHHKAGYDIIPTFHPSAVLRDYSRVPIVVADLDRARRHVEHGLKATDREILVPETRLELEEAFAKLGTASIIAVDVETEEQQITCISLAPSPELVYVIPLWNKGEPGWSAWTLDTEVYIWYSLKMLLERKQTVFHNAIYDLTYLAEVGIQPQLVPHDTMLLHHAAQPELPKSLGFMASMYLDQPSWKWMRVKAAKDVAKKDE